MKQFQLEYVFKNISVLILWKLISTPQGFASWFSDGCEEREKKFIFSWNKMEETAILLEMNEEESIRFKWEDEPDTFFEFQIHTNSLTQDVTLTIIDYAEEDELEDSKMLWDAHIDNLKLSSGI